MKSLTKSVYFAGELFSLKHLAGNAMLAESIYRESAGTYRCVLPQDLEQRETTPQAIRDQDIRSLIACDVALFNFDGDEIDSGTVVEYMIAKFADIPSVILRSDFRRAGDHKVHPWNLMLSDYPRSEVMTLDSVAAYQSQLRPAAHGGGVGAVQKTYKALAENIILAFKKVEGQPPVMPAHLRNYIYEWLRIMPGEKFAENMPKPDLDCILQRKIDLGLLG